MAGRRRLDAELVRRGLAVSRTQAQHLIAEGSVSVRGAAATKAATMVDAGDAILIRERAEAPYASRAGHKLAGALDRLELSVEGRCVLDAGAAHGGFTDVALRRGAVRVVAVDVAYGQLDWRLREDPRVVVVERTNVRTVTSAEVGEPAPDVVVADLSFISLALVIPALRRVAAGDADFALMVKPQFEAGRDAVARGGVVRDPQAWATSMAAAAAAAQAAGLGLAGACVSPLPGPAGNIEFFLHLRAGAAGDVTALIDQAVEEGRRLRGDGGG